MHIASGSNDLLISQYLCHHCLKGGHGSGNFWCYSYQYCIVLQNLIKSIKGEIYLQSFLSIYSSTRMYLNNISYNQSLSWVSCTEDIQRNSSPHLLHQDFNTRISLLQGCHIDDRGF